MARSILSAAAIAALGAGMCGPALAGPVSWRDTKRLRDQGEARRLRGRAKALRAQASGIHGRGRMKKKRALIQQAEELESRAERLAAPNPGGKEHG